MSHHSKRPRGGNAPACHSLFEDGGFTVKQTKFPAQHHSCRTNTQRSGALNHNITWNTPKSLYKNVPQAFRLLTIQRSHKPIPKKAFIGGNSHVLFISISFFYEACSPITVPAHEGAIIKKREAPAVRTGTDRKVISAEKFADRY